MARTRDPQELVAAVAAGDRSAVARLISVVERGGDDARETGRRTFPLSGKAYTFMLRRDVQFHDGAELTAEDVKATFDRIVKPHRRRLIAPVSARKEAHSTDRSRFETTCLARSG